MQTGHVHASQEPSTGERADLSILVQLQPACPHSVHDGSIVDDSDLDALLLCPQLQVIVRRGPEEHPCRLSAAVRLAVHTRQPPVL